MFGFPSAKRAKQKGGGPIVGQGTGTSDSIDKQAPVGSYIMPADSTAAIGHDGLAKLGLSKKSVPVKVSNGEYEMPPEQVHAVGVQALNQIKDATHQPVAQPAQGPQQFFANGGAISNPLEGVGEYWSKDNAEFEAGNPGLIARTGRALNPLTGFGSAVGAMHDAAGQGSIRDMGIAAVQSIPVFGAMRTVAPTLKTAAGLAPSLGKTAIAGSGSVAAGVGADEMQAQSFANGGPVFSGVDPDELGRSNTPKRAVIPKAAPNFHVDASGTATKSLPSPSRAVVPYQGPGTQLTTTAQPRPAPAAAPKADFYGNSRGATGKGFQPSSSTAVTPSGPMKTHQQQPPSPAPAARPALEAPRAATPPYEPDYKTRAESKARASKDTAAFEADRAKQDARFNQAAAEGQRAPAASGGGARGFINKAGKGGALLAAVPAIAAATDEDSTARYAERFGVSEPTGDGSLEDIAKFTALRAGGFATDVGSSLTFGLADSLYRDKQQVDTQLLGAGAGAVAGGATGSKIAPMTGRGVDKVAGFVSRGRYKGDAAERLGKKVGTVGGAVAGGSAGASIGQPSADNPYNGESFDQWAKGQSAMRSTSPAAASADKQGNGYRMIGTDAERGLDPGIAVKVGADGVPMFTNDKQAIAGAGGDFVASGFPRDRQSTPAGQMVAPAGSRVLASGTNAPTEAQQFAQLGSVRNLNNGIGTFSQAESGDAQLAYDRNERAIAERDKMIGISRRGEIGEGGGRVTVVRDSSRSPTIADMLGARLDGRKAQTEALRTDAQLGLKREAREAADSQLNQSVQQQQLQVGNLDMADRQRIQSLYAQYESAAPGDRAALAEQIRVLTGKDQAQRFTVVPGGQEYDTTAGALVNRPARVFNDQTGEFVDQQGGGQAAQLEPGTVRNGYKFNGGNPADKNNWSKV